MQIEHTGTIQGPTKTFEAEISIAAAAVLTLRATPVELVPAPGVGFVNVFIGGELILDYTAPAFTEGAVNLAVRLGDGTGVIVSDTIEMTGFIDQAADTLTSMRAKLDAIATKAQAENKALVLHNTGGAEFGNAGGSTLRVKVKYAVFETGL
ncbi:hypothetical protein KW797_03170 [Candidatus Parcubacteria bacterium]|nr:hypothetical protein [Candidatus Parcubacteria bacterium]